MCFTEDTLILNIKFALWLLGQKIPLYRLLLNSISPCNDCEMSQDLKLPQKLMHSSHVLAASIIP